MLSFLGAKTAQHPLADAKALESALKALPGDSTRALEEIGTLLEELRSSTTTPTAMAEAFETIDAAAQVHARRVAREFAGVRGNRAQSQRLLGVLRLFWRRNAEALASPLDAHVEGIVRGADGVKRLAPILVPRSLRAWSNLAKWQAIDYTPLEPQAWARITNAFALAERLKIASNLVQPYPRVPIETTIQREFAGLLGFVASGPDGLPAHLIEVLDRLVAALSDQFTVSTQLQPGASFAIEIGAATPPLRVGTGLQAHPNVRVLTAAGLVKQAESLVNEITVSGTLPASVALGEDIDVNDVSEVLRHLIDIWGPESALRRHQRRKMEVRLTVGYGFDGLVDVLVALPAVGTMLDFSSESPIETWVTEDVGFGGFGAVAPSFKDDRLSIGNLVAIQADGAPGWQVGAVRRLGRRPDGRVFVAVETLARAPVPTEVSVETNGQRSRVPEVAILLAPPVGATTINVLLRAGSSGAGQTYVFEHESVSYAMEPRRLLARGPDYELLECAIKAS
jgi:hypothetical protein